MENKNSTHIFMNDKHLKDIPKDIESKRVCVLYLHNNSIGKIVNLTSKLSNVTHLYLQWNKIRQIENLNCLSNLNKLYLGHNRINVVEKLEDLKNLKELHVEHQTLENGETVCFDPRCVTALGSRLQVLNISGNQLYHFNELPSFKNLNVLLAKNNNLNDYQAIAEDLKRLLKIKEVDLRGNPVCKNHRYKEKIIAACFKISTLDGKSIPEQTRHFLKCFDRFQCNQSIKYDSFDRRKVYDQVNTERSSKSPDTHLAILEAQRASALQARLSRQKMMESTNGVIPRCFWRNKNIKINNESFDKGENTPSDFSKITGTIWP